MTNLGGVGEQDIPLSQPEHGLLRGGGNERCRLGQGQPPILGLALRITANIAMVGLGKRHSKSLRPARVAPSLATALSQRQTSRSIVWEAIPGSGDALRSELSSIRRANSPPSRYFSPRAYRLRYIVGRVRRYLRADPRTAPADSRAFSTDRSLPAADEPGRFRSAAASLPSWRRSLRWGRCNKE